MAEWFNSLSDLARIYAFIAIPSTVVLLLQSILVLIGAGANSVDADVSDVSDVSGLTDAPDVPDDVSADMPDIPDDVSADDASADAPDAPSSPHDHGLSLFSVRGIMAFLCVGSWSGLVMADNGVPTPLTIILSFLIGTAALFGMAFMVKSIMKLQSAGNLDISNALGKIGEVYIPIPAEGKGKGKITVIIQEKFTEISAVTTDKVPIKTGESVRIVATNGSDLVSVERISKEFGGK